MLYCLLKKRQIQLRVPFNYGWQLKSQKSIREIKTAKCFNSKIYNSKTQEIILIDILNTRIY